MIGNSNFGIFCLAVSIVSKSSLISLTWWRAKGQSCAAQWHRKGPVLLGSDYRVLLLSAFEVKCCQVIWPVNNECSLIYFLLLDDSCLIAWSIYDCHLCDGLLLLYSVLLFYERGEQKSESLCFPELCGWGGNARFFFLICISIQDQNLLQCFLWQHWKYKFRNHRQFPGDWRPNMWIISPPTS